MNALLTVDGSGSGFPIRSNYRFILILSLIILWNIILGLDMLRLKETIGYDESISYLVATCHQETYSESSFDAAPKPGSHWNRLVREVEQPFCYAQIARGLGNYDIHPPLYFWLLHLWLLVVGVHIWSGPLLNIVIALCTAVILMRVVAQVLKDRKETILFALTFALNPSVLLLVLEVRQYTLLSLWAVLFVWQTIQYADKPRGQYRLVLVGVLAVLGLLTHYQFLILLIGGALFVTARLIGSNRRKVGLFFLCSGLACLIAYAAHPYFFDSFQRQLSANSNRSLADWASRLENVSTAFITYSYLLPALVVSLILGWKEARRSRKTVAAYLAGINRKGAGILFFALWTTGAVVAQHLAFLSPAHALGPPKYLAFAWPFLPIVALCILRIANNRQSLLLYLTAIPIFLALLFPLEMRIDNSLDMSPIRAQNELILVDNPARGIFLQVAWFLPDDVPVIVDTQEDLIQDSDRWLPYLNEGALYISEATEPAARWRQRQIIETLRASGFVVESLAAKTGSKSTRFDAYRVWPTASQ